MNLKALLSNWKSTVAGGAAGMLLLIERATGPANLTKQQWIITTAAALALLLLGLSAKDFDATS
jgi:hypothetical protein